jgi:hypothetical protein
MFWPENKPDFLPNELLSYEREREAKRMAPQVSVLGVACWWLQRWKAPRRHEMEVPAGEVRDKVQEAEVTQGHGALRCAEVRGNQGEFKRT